MLEYLFITFLVIVCIQSVYYLLIFGSFSFSKSKKTEINFNKDVSVVICAKNEAKNLKKNLPYFLNQEYSNFEIILINDCSTDDTLSVMEQFKLTSSIPIKIVNVAPNEQFWGSKKYALTLGIKAASYEFLLFSDADCKPISRQWIQEMTNLYIKPTQLVLGYGSYSKVKGSILNKLIRFETLLTAIQYFSYAKIGLPYMGVGRNLSYTKSLFFKNNGFVNHMNIKSGDDDLFINDVATKNNCAICFSENSFTESAPKTTFSSWIQQKRRHISTSNFYKLKHKLLLGLFYLSQLLFWLLSIILVLFYPKFTFVIGLILIRFIIIYFSIGFSAKKLNEKDLVLFAPFFELFLILIQMFIFIKNLISKPKHW